ncbi:hypothetical protein HPB48_009993 [Haemaphysalis longicornis]|uniref:Uncharacterized protein n=1 Tax=Haemaphysalis longicornis TaxID=44386 RepID=A0A9J6FN19_HAELO|nr:hypothetical protein HPB48_009993 [Haemaphysalis longicornis]
MFAEGAPLSGTLNASLRRELMRRSWFVSNSPTLICGPALNEEYLLFGWNHAGQFFLSLLTALLFLATRHIGLQGNDKADARARASHNSQQQSFDGFQIDEARNIIKRHLSTSHPDPRPTACPEKTALSFSASGQATPGPPNADIDYKRQVPPCATYAKAQMRQFDTFSANALTLTPLAPLS